jgi:hypothetical protein
MALTKELVMARPPEGPWEPVGFEGGFGPKGLGNSAQALAWVALFLRASPVRAPDNAGAIHIDRTQIQMTISSAPSGLVAFIVTPPRLKPGLGSQGPSGRNRLQIRQAPGLSFQGPSGGNRLQSPTRSWAKLPWPFRPPSCTQPYPLNQITYRD